MFHNGHYFTIYNKTTGGHYKCDRCGKYSKRPHRPCRYTQCNECGVWWLRKHTHDESKRAWRNNGDRRKLINTIVTAGDIFESAPISTEDKIIFDFECFNNEKKEHEVYACGWMKLSENTFQVSWGELSLDEFYDYIIEQSTLQKKKLTLIGFNNSGYDNHFLIRKSLERGIEPKFVIHHSNIIEMKTKHFKVFDVYRFVPGSSLAKACGDFGAPQEYTKTHFPHKFITSWDTLNYIGQAPGKEFYHKDPPSDWEYPSEWNLKEVCINYLEKDILATKFIFEKLTNLIFEKFHTHITKFVTISQLGFEFWSNLITCPTRGRKFTPENIPVATKENQIKLTIPNPEEQDIYKRATYGGRSFLTRRQYISPDYESFMSNKKRFEDINEYIFNGDVVSLYPTAMRNFEYPFGDPYFVEDLSHITELLERKQYEDIPLGFYEISYKSNKKIIIPPIPRKEFRESNLMGEVITSELIWDLKNNVGWYTSVDMINALKLNYEIEILRAYVFPSKGFIFKDYIDICFDIKREGEETGNDSMRNTGKIVMNSLYGKMLQIPIICNHEILKKRESLEDFLSKYELQDLIFISNEKHTVIAKGKIKSLEDSITKPSYLGAYVLSYSRLVMEEYINKFDPKRLTDICSSMENSLCYTDTDSGQFIIKEEWQKELISELDRPGELGAFTNDLKNNAKILRAIWLAPKTYYLEYVDSKKPFEIQIKKKSKGVKSDKLKYEDFLKMLQSEQTKKIESEIIKKVGLNESNIRKEKREPFSILSIPNDRYFLKELWKGRQFTENHFNCSVPFCFEL
jgi:hypothetical protein